MFEFIEYLDEVLFWLIMAVVAGIWFWLACCNDRNKGGMYDD